jgi:hypothetical protein
VQAGRRKARKLASKRHQRGQSGAA